MCFKLRCMTDQVRLSLVGFMIMLAGVTLHEWAKAFMATVLGDDTPRLLGRLTLNPLVHMDILGTVVVPLCIFFFFPNVAPFGWGKNVSFNENNFRHRRFFGFIVGCSGPLANILVALSVSIVGGFCARYYPHLGPLIGNVVWINTLLAILNLIPFPPFDGGIIVKYLFNLSEQTYALLAQWSLILVFVLINIPWFQIIFGVMLKTVVALCLLVASICAGTSLTLFLPAFSF